MTHKLIVIHIEGQITTADFKGFYSETLGDAAFRSARDDKWTAAVALFHDDAIRSIHPKQALST